MRNKHLFLLLLAAFFAPLAMKAQSTLTVHDGTETSERVPIFSWHANLDQQSQLIYPASELTAMSGKALTQMVFYWQQGQYGDDYSVGTWTISLGETTATAFNDGFDTTTPLTEVFTGVLDEAGGLFNTTDHTLTIAFDEEYAYQGGNLLVQFAHTGTGEEMDYHFIGQSMDEATSYLCCYSDGTAYIDESNNFLPKTTFTYQAQPNCPKPTNLAVSYTEGDPTATVTWTSDATNFNIDVNGTITAVTGNTYTFAVSLLTTYTIKVQAVCGDEQSFWTKAISFISVCGIFPVTYSYGFEDESDIDCWTIITTGYYGEYTGIYEDEDDEDYAHTGSHSFRFYYTTVPGQYLISPKLGGFENGLHVEFWYREYSEGYPETFQVGYSTTDNDPDSFTWGDEITATTSYQQFKANYPADTKYVAVKHTSDGQWNLYFDDFLFEESPSCIEPTGVQVADVTTNSATISWTAGGSETAWDIYVTADATIVPDDNTTPTVANANNNSYSLSNLSAGTIYYVYVRAICSGTEVSDWSLPATFATICNPIALPWIENFNNFAGPGMPACWNTIIEGSGSCSIESVSGGNNVLDIFVGQSSGFSNAAVVLPKIDANYPLNQCQISFDACHWSDNGSTTPRQLLIFVLNDPTDLQSGVGFFVDSIVDITNAYPTFGSYTVKFDRYEGTGQYIALVCGGNESSDPYDVLIDNIVVSEATDCNPITLPWNEDFDNLAAGEGVPACWNSIIDGSGSCSIAPLSEDNDNNVLDIHIGQSSGFSNAAVVLPKIDANYPLNQCQISFDASYYSESTTPRQLAIFVLNDPTDLQSGVGFFVDSIVDITDGYPTFGNYTVQFNNYEGTGQYIALVCGGNESSGPYDVLIDNIVLSEASSCLYPTGLAANAASTSAELSWTANNSETSWTLYWKEVGADEYTEVPNVTDNPYTLSNLSAATTYEFYVVAHCDENDHSAPSALYTFTTTDCNPITLPWSEDFDDLAEGEGVPACWETIIDGSGSCSIAPFSGDGNNGLVISINGSSLQNSVTVVLPEVDASYPLNQCQISFDASYWSSNESTTEELLFVIPANLTTVASEEDIIPVAITDAYPNIGRHTVRFNDYEGNGQYITLVCTGGGSFGGGDPYAVFIDNIEVSPLPSCMPPANLIASNITGSSAQLAWTANGQSAWDIYVTNDATDVPDDDTTPTVANTEDNPYSLTELNSLTTYYVYVRAICGENEVSEWSSRATFTTKCATTTVNADNPYTQNFNDETFPPDCWELGGDPISNWYQTVQGYAYTEYNPTYLYMPFLHIDANNAVLTFKTEESRIEFYTGGSEGYDGLSIVKVSTDGGGTWTQLWCPTYDELTTDFRTVTLSLYDYVGQDILIAFEHQGRHGWTIDDVEVKVAPLATFTKTIEGYGEGNGGWYLIASPVLSVTPTAANGFITDEFGSNIPEGESGTYDLYYFDQTGGSNGKEWKNYRAHHNDATYPFNALVNGKGYLYASKNRTELTFAGTLYSGDGQVALVYSESNPSENMRGWNLVGNPFTVGATSSQPFYRMNEGGTALSAQVEAGNTVEAMEGVFVQATAANQVVTFTAQTRGGEKSAVAALNISLSKLIEVKVPEPVEGPTQNNGVSTSSTTLALDNAIIRFDGGQTLEKFSFREGSTKIYIPQDGTDYAIACAESTGEMPLNFKAKENGTYTLTVSPTLNSQLSTLNYLHLIDNLTGADVDLLAPNGGDARPCVSSYTFTAKTTDYASRFRLVFSICEDANGDNETFAFIDASGNIIVNGTGTLQVIDMTGRVLYTAEANSAFRIQHSAFPTPGVYVLRLINGDDVRTQKIVVK